ncbi:MAG TPA: CHRD domain-containing protein [Ktedonobacteraceae bacterium]|nr:CHRD domain-containing protein [Ktedonobacteraceae bacterium]
MNRVTSKIIKTGFLAALLVLTLTVVTSFAVFAQGRDEGSQAQATLRHMPHGAAVLFWSPMTHTLTVTTIVSGLQDNSSHPAHIHMGSCAAGGPIIIPLNDVKADAGGNAVTTTTIPNVMNGIPATGWFVNVHAGPTLADGQATPITCGDVVNREAGEHEFQFVFLRLGTTTAANQNASGTAHLSLDNGTLTVQVTVKGLVPGSMHAAHIHLGSCERQVPGNVMFPLNTLTADANGVAMSTTVIHNVNMNEIPEHGWYVNVHFSTDLSTQVGFDPIACGDVVD